MKSIVRIKYFILCSVIYLLMAGCNKNVTDFGFDGILSGTVKTADGKIIAGDITNNSLFIQAFGDRDVVTTIIRVKGDGTYENTKLFPTKYKIWLSGAVKIQGADTIEIDFSRQKDNVLDFIVIPYLTIKTPVVNGSLTSTSVNIDYDIIGNIGYVSKARNIYCGTYPYPNGNIGSGPFYYTIKVPLISDKGMATIAGLTSKTKYYIRIGAKADGSSYENYSEQVIITTP